MSSDDNETSENDEHDFYNRFGVLEDAKPYVDYDVGTTDNISDVTPDNNFEPKKMKRIDSNESLSSYLYGGSDTDSDLGDLPADIQIEGDGSYSSDNFSPPNSISFEANASNSDLRKVAMQITENDYATESNYAEDKVINEIINAKTIPVSPDCLYEKGKKGKHIRNIRYEDIDIKVKEMLLKKKYNPVLDNGEKRRTCNKADYKNQGGYEIDKITVKEITTEDKRRYEEFIKIIKICCSCGNEVSYSEIFQIKEENEEDEGYIICNRCVEEEEIDTFYLKNNVYDSKIYTDEKLYKCKRLNHSFPLYQFMKYSETTKKYGIVKNCCYCRLYKAQENVIKKLQQYFGIKKRKIV